MHIYIITGVTGFLGNNIAKRILSMDDTLVCGIARHAITETTFDATRFVSNVADVADAEGCYSAIRELLVKVNASANDSIYLIHCAATTQSAQMIKNPERTYADIVEGTRNIMGIAKNISCKSVVNLSSMEVYGQVDDEHFRTEDELGILDTENPRSCYPMAKREAERICSEYAKAGIPVKTARLAQVFGKGIRSDDNRVFAQFARSALQSRNIVMHTKGQSFGNYCGLEDTIDAILTILLQGENGAVYNVVNEQNTMRIREMAELVASEVTVTCGLSIINVEYDIPQENMYGYAADTLLHMSSEKLRGLGWNPTKRLLDMYVDVLDEMMN